MAAPWVIEDADARTAAQRFLDANSTLHDLLRAGGEVLSVVEQDEFTHDVVGRIPGPKGELLVVFDST